MPPTHINSPPRCPVQAEEDRRWVKAHQVFVAKQQAVMKDVSWELGRKEGSREGAAGPACSFSAQLPLPPEAGPFSPHPSPDCRKSCCQSQQECITPTCSPVSPPPPPTTPPPCLPLQNPDYKPEESVYKTRWMPPAKPVGAWA